MDLGLGAAVGGMGAVAIWYVTIPDTRWRCSQLLIVLIILHSLTFLSLSVFVFVFPMYLSLYLSFLSLLWLEGTWGVLKKDWQQDMQVSKQLDQGEGSCCWTFCKIQQCGHYSGLGVSLLQEVDRVCRWSQRQGQSRWSWSCRNHSRWWPNLCHQEHTNCRHWTCRFRRQTWRKTSFNNFQ